MKSWCGCCVDFWVFGRVLFRGGSRGLRAKVFDKFYDSTCRWRRCWLHFTIWQNNYFSDPVYTMHWVLVYSGSEKYLFGLNYTLCVRHRLYFVCIGCGWGYTAPHLPQNYSVRYTVYCTGGDDEAAAFVTPCAKNCTFCKFL